MADLSGANEYLLLAQIYCPACLEDGMESYLTFLDYNLYLIGCPACGTNYSIEEFVEMCNKRKFTVT
jgi:hypothetical protein